MKSVPNISGERAVETFVRSYARVPLASSEYVKLTEDPLDEDIPIVPGWEHWGIANFPTDRHKYSTDPLDLRGVIRDLNQVMVYRALRRAYGKHDAPIVARNAEGKAVPAVWSYLVNIRPDLIAAISSRASRVIVTFHSMSPQPTPEAADDIKKFLHSLSELHSRCEGLFDEGAFVKDENTHWAYHNLYLEKLESANQLLKLAQDAEVRRKIEYWQFDDLLSGNFNADVPNALLFSAGTLYFIALEALINLLYELLLKKSVGSSELLRDLLKKDLHLRMAALHELCDGFERPPFPPGSTIPTKVRDAQVWRNKVLHGEVTEEHRIYFAIENGANLFFAPLCDNRGVTGNRRRRHGASKSQVALTPEQVNELKSLLQEVRDAIVISLRPEYSKSIDAALRQRVVVPFY